MPILNADSENQFSSSLVSRKIETEESCKDHSAQIDRSITDDFIRKFWKSSDHISLNPLFHFTQ